MNLYCDIYLAYRNARNRYLSSPKEKIFYIFGCSVNRRNFFTVLSEDEAKRYKVAVKNARLSVGTQDSEKKIRADYQARVSSQQGQEERMLLRLYRNQRQGRKLHAQVIEAQSKRIKGDEKEE